MLRLCEKYKQKTLGYFDAFHSGVFDPSGLVKGWAIEKAERMLRKKGATNFCVEAGGDMVCCGKNEHGDDWSVGVRMPHDYNTFAKIITLRDMAIATSGTYIRGAHIYNPHGNVSELASVTVVGPSIMQADIYATAIFAMGSEKGLAFIASCPGYETYVMIDEHDAVLSPGFNQYVRTT